MGIPTVASEQGSSAVADALFSKVQQRVLGVLFGNPRKSFYANEIIALAGSGTGAVQRELRKLENAGLVIAWWVGNQKHYRVNEGVPMYRPLRELILKTTGLADVLRSALAPFGKNIRAAFVYGSVAKGNDRAMSDIDIMVISDELSYADLFPLLEAASKRLGRAVNPTIYSSSELAKRVDRRNSFVTRVLSQPKIWLKGGEDELTSR